MRVLFPDPLAPTRARLCPARIRRLKCLNTITSGRVGYAKSTCRKSSSPRTGSIGYASGSMRVQLLRMANTDRTDSPPRTISGASLAISGT
jgi:hypothetical protein